MRGLSTPSALMISPKLFAHSNSFSRLSYDLSKAKELLSEAGYPNGFEVGMDCPNNRYVNDEAICQATVSMLAKIGIKVNLLAQPKALYFKKVLNSSNRRNNNRRTSRIRSEENPGDNWELVIDQGTTIEGLVMALTMYMRKTKFKGHYRLEPLNGKLYAIRTEEIEIEEPEPMKFDLYGEY